MDKFLQKITVKASEQFSLLSSREKAILLDQFMASDGKKALAVTFPFSHSGRLINRRVYSRAGHLQAVDSLLNPYPKPLNLDHEEKSVDRIIGRFAEARYVDTIDKAASYLQAKGHNPSLARDLSNALTILDFEKAANIFHKTKVLKDRNWPGIGYIDAKVRVTDRGAIEKFIDERYMNFSAEQDTDRFVCSVCLEDWAANGGPCEHTPGKSYDGKLAFVMTGNMTASGAGVVVHPGDDLSFSTSLTLTDAEEDVIEIYSKMTDVFMVDSVSELINETKEILMNELVAKLLKGEKLTDEELTSVYDSAFVADEAGKLSIEDRAALPPTALVNGFPIHDSVHAKAIMALIESHLPVDESTKTIVDAINVKVLAFSDEEGTEQIADSVRDAREAADPTELEALKAEIQILKDQILTTNLGHKIATEARDASDAKFAEAELKLTDALENIGTLNTKASRLEERARALSAEYRELMKDHVGLAKKYEVNTKQLNDFADKTAGLIGIVTGTKDAIDKNIENIYQLLDSVDFESLESKLNNGLQRDAVEKVQDPLLGEANDTSFSDDEDEESAPTLKDIAELPSFQRSIIAKFREISDSQSVDAAKLWFSTRVKSYCDDNFDPLSYMENK